MLGMPDATDAWHWQIVAVAGLGSVGLHSLGSCKLFEVKDTYHAVHTLYVESSFQCAKSYSNGLL